MPASSRFRFASKIAGIHLSISLLVAVLVACLVFFIWYPPPFRQLTGSFQLFWLVIIVDVICGPALTFILASPRKKRPEVILDFSLIALIQISALVYGMHTVYSARPVVLVYQLDRLRVLSQNEILTEELPQASADYQTLPKFAMLRVAARAQTATDDPMQIVETALQGYDIGQRPSWWIPYNDARDTMKEHARPLSALADSIDDDKKALLEEALRPTGLSIKHFRYLPLTSKDQYDWTAILDGDMQIVDVVPIDAFGQ